MAFESNFPTNVGPSGSAWDPGTNGPSGNWTSGNELPGGTGDTGNPTTPGSSFNVGPGQIPSDIYNQLVQSGLLTPGANVPVLTGHGLTLPGAGGGAGGKGSAFSMTNPDGSINWASLIPLLASLGGGAYAAYNTNKAAGQMTDAIKSANTQISSIIGQQQGGYAPYQQMGTTALGNLANYQYHPLAGNFPSAVAPKGK